MSLVVEMAHAFDGFDLDLALEAGPGVTAIFGPSGAGKTTLIKAVAGLFSVDKGRVVLRDRVLFDSTTGVNVPVPARRVGYVFQDARLFPHMSVAQNIRFGMRFAPSPPGSDEEARVVEMLGLDALLERRPGGLSGGEAQRVALARALLSSPEILLMDEPLAALDAPRKEDILPYLEELRDSTPVPILYVSHQLSEVARLADALVILKAGRVAVQGRVENVLSDPAALPFVGVREAGAVLPATVVAHEADGLTRLRLSGGDLLLPAVAVEVGSPMKIRVLASDILISLERPTGISSRNVLPVTIRSLHRGSGPGVAVQLACGDDLLLARITARAADELELRPGLACFAVLKATAVPRGSIGAARKL